MLVAMVDSVASLRPHAAPACRAVRLVDAVWPSEGCDHHFLGHPDFHAARDDGGPRLVGLGAGCASGCAMAEHVDAVEKASELAIVHLKCIIACK